MAQIAVVRCLPLLRRSGQKNSQVAERAAQHPRAAGPAVEDRGSQRASRSCRAAHDPVPGVCMPQRTARSSRLATSSDAPSVRSPHGSSPCRLLELRHANEAGAVLCRMRQRARVTCNGAARQSGIGQVLRRVRLTLPSMQRSPWTARQGAADRRPSADGGRCRSCSPTGRFHDLSEGRDAEDTRELLTVLRDGAGAVGAARRDGREVHRRRGDGGLGAPRPTRTSRASGSRRDGAGQRRPALGDEQHPQARAGGSPVRRRGRCTPTKGLVAGDMSTPPAGCSRRDSRTVLVGEGTFRAASTPRLRAGRGAGAEGQSQPGPAWRATPSCETG